MPSLDLRLVRASKDPNRLSYQLKDRTGDQRGGSEWEPIKILLERDAYSKKMNAATKHVSGSTTQVGQDHIATRVLMVLGTNTQPFEPSTPNTQRKFARLVACATPVRPLACAGQTGGHKPFQVALVTSLGPGTKPPQKTQHAREENPTPNLAKLLEISQELICSNTRQQGTHQDIHPRQIPQRACTGQTGQEHRSDQSRLGSSR
jgi:hypothetical protein